MNETEFSEYYSEIENELIGIGYSKHFVQCFRFDIAEYWENRKSIQECIDYIV